MTAKCKNFTICWERFVKSCSLFLNCQKIGDWAYTRGRTSLESWFTWSRQEWQPPLKISQKKGCGTFYMKIWKWKSYVQVASHICLILMTEKTKLFSTIFWLFKRFVAIDENWVPHSTRLKQKRSRSSEWKPMALYQKRALAFVGKLLVSVFEIHCCTLIGWTYWLEAYLTSVPCNLSDIVYFLTLHGAVEV